jgi:hypothetical protein
MSVYHVFLSSSIKKAVWLAQLVKSLVSSCVCSLICVQAGGPRFNSRYTDKANQTFYPFGIGKIGSSLYIVGYCYRRLRVSGTEGR